VTLHLVVPSGFAERRKGDDEVGLRRKNIFSLPGR